MAFRVTDADVVRTCTIGNRAVASRGSSRLSPGRKSKEPLSRRVVVGKSQLIFLSLVGNFSLVFSVVSISKHFSSRACLS